MVFVLWSLLYMAHDCGLRNNARFGKLYALVGILLIITRDWINFPIQIVLFYMVFIVYIVFNFQSKLVLTDICFDTCF